VRWNDRAVGGFLEDLSVMVFVLAGVSLLVSSYAWSSSLAHARADQERLEWLAEGYIDRVMAEIHAACRSAFPPSLASLRALDLSGLAEVSLPGRSVVASISTLHPYPELVINFSSAAHPIADVVGYSARLCNAVDSDGIVAIVEVRCLVW